MTPVALTLLLAGLGTGVLSGLFGVGGGFILVPVLSASGWPMTIAVGTSLLYIVVTAFWVTLLRVRGGALDWPIIARLSLPAALGAPVGAWLAGTIPESWLQLLFSVLLVGVAWHTGRTTRERSALMPGTARRQGPALVLGGLTGLLSGVFGVGGGIILVPGQLMLFGLPIATAVANSLAVIALTGLTGVTAHAWAGHLDWQAACWLIPGGLLGSRAGTWLLQRVSAQRMRRGFAALLVLLALQGVARAIWSFWQNG